jgi:hypothetical protein
MQSRATGSHVAHSRGIRSTIHFERKLTDHAYGESGLPLLAKWSFYYISTLAREVTG